LGVLGGWRQQIFLFFFDLNLSFFLVPSEPSKSNDGQDPEHPEQDTNAATKDEGNKAAFPWAKSHERKLETMSKAVRATVVTIVSTVMVHLVVVIDRRLGAKLNGSNRVLIVIAGRVWLLVVGFLVVMRVLVVPDRGESNKFPEPVDYPVCLATAAWLLVWVMNWDSGGGDLCRDVHGRVTNPDIRAWECIRSLDDDDADGCC